jgi:hypothetical protein
MPAPSNVARTIGTQDRVRESLAAVARYGSPSLHVVAYPLSLVDTDASRGLLQQELSKSPLLALRRFEVPDGVVFCCTDALSSLTSHALFDTPPFWLSMRIHDDALVTCVFAPDMTTAHVSRTLQRIHHLVQAVCHRVNQMGLLTTLNATRVASQYLIAASDEDQSLETVVLDFLTFSKSVCLGTFARKFSCLFSHLFEICLSRDA